jgi:hypothetical protein
VCEALGINEWTQQRKLKERPWSRTVIMTVRDARGHNQDAFCVDLDTLPSWLTSIEPSKVKPKVRPRLEDFQRECARVLSEHFFGPRRARAQSAANDNELKHRLDVLTQNPERMHSRAELRDNPRERRVVWNLITSAAREQQCSTQLIQGQLKRQYQTLSYLRLPAYTLDSVIAFLNDLIARRVLLRPATTTGNRRQTSFTGFDS